MIGGSRRIATLLASLLLASPALAQPKGTSDKDKQVAGDLVKKAIARSQAGDHSAAIEIYLQAYTILPNPLLLSNIGAEYQQSGKPQEALRYFCMYLDKDPTGTNVPYATSQAKTLQIQLGNKSVDERNVCAPKAEPRTEPRKPPRAPDPDPDPDPDPKPPPPKRQPPKPEEPGDEGASSGGSSKVMYVGLAAGIAGLGAAGIGVYDGIQAKSLSDQVSNHVAGTPWPNNIQEIQRRGQAYENLQVGFLIAGGVLVTTGAILFVVGRPDSSKRPADKADKAMVSVTPTPNGFAVFGRF
jgi:tetratricopeptide (TPR) repeat protein